MIYVLYSSNESSCLGSDVSAASKTCLTGSFLASSSAFFTFAIKA